ncbi:MAG: acylneuraminate cytidylyltransferase [Saprospiraceae bacterium]|nr:MAG: acylneuraminate cytidylyltransferase [Saprospiraceae bacterium]
MRTMKSSCCTLFITLLLTTFCQAQDWAKLNHFKEENTKLEMPKAEESRIVFMGNSITEGWKNMRPAFFADKPYINRGIGGQTTPQMLIRFRPDVVDLQPDVVVILAGINDIAGNTGPSTIKMIADNIFSMAEIAAANGIKVVLSSVLPAFDFPWRAGMEPAEKVVELNKRIKAYAEKNDHIYLDYFQAMVDEQNGLKAELTYDGVHPNEAGYQVMEPQVEVAIAQALK